MMQLNRAIEVFRSYDSSQGLDMLLECRKTISLSMWELAGKIADLEMKSKEATAGRKIDLAVNELQSNKPTVSERKAHAIEMTREQSMAEARYEGELKAHRIKYDSLGEISNAISSFLKNG